MELTVITRDEFEKLRRQKNQEDFNPAMSMFGIEKITKIVRDAALYNKTLVSVGSGIAKLEHETGLNWICIDPAPDSYIKRNVYIYPEYSTVEKYLESGKYPGDCVLLLNWPYHGDHDGYDSEAVEKLNPQRVILIGETMGGSGSQGLRDVLNKKYQIKSEYLLRVVSNMGVRIMEYCVNVYTRI